MYISYFKNLIIMLVYFCISAIVEYGSKKTDNVDDFFLIIASYYVKSMEDMNDRAPGLKGLFETISYCNVKHANILGNTCIKGASQLNPTKAKGYIIPFNERSIQISNVLGKI